MSDITEQGLINEGYDKETRAAILKAIENYPSAEQAILDIADLAKSNGADNATNGFGYPVDLGHDHDEPRTPLPRLWLGYPMRPSRTPASRRCDLPTTRAGSPRPGCDRCRVAPGARQPGC
jgi:hypothetical protein